MDQKRFASIALAALVIIIAGAAGYFALRKQTAEPTVGNVQPPATNQASLPPQAGMLRYLSSHNFSIDYPANWRIESTIENFGSISEAEKVSGNHFSIYSYPANNSYNPGAPVPQKEIKIEIWISGNVYKSLDEWINSLALKNILRTENIIINGKNAKKILYSGEGDAGSFVALTVFYLDGNKAAEFISYPADTKYSQEFDAIVKTFRFTN